MKTKLPKKKSKFMVIFLSVVVFIAIGAILFWLICFLSEKFNPPSQNIKYGVTFSPYIADNLGFDWKQVYKEILDDLGVKNLRLSGYWSEIEKKPGVYDFVETDFLISEAAKRKAEVVLTLGVKQPRWPECHLPDWARKLSTEDRQKKTLEFIQKVVQRYKTEPAISAWQVENEPFFYPYGYNCYPPDGAFLKKEVELVKNLDSRPVIITETGELAFWLKQMQLSDIFGTTLYRVVWDSHFGYIKYPLSPGFYSLKSNLFRLFAPNNKKTIISELQAEPWLPKNNPLNTPLSNQLQVFPLKQLQENVDFANKTSFDEIYLWGVEWWYFMKEKGYPEYWDYTRQLFN